MEETTLLLKSTLSVTTIRPTVSAFKCFHTSSSGLRSGEYGGRKNSFSLPPRVSIKALVFFARCAGPRSTIRKIDESQNRSQNLLSKFLLQDYRDAGWRVNGCKPKLAVNSEPYNRKLLPQRPEGLRFFLCTFATFVVNVCLGHPRFPSLGPAPKHGLHALPRDDELLKSGKLPK